MAESNKENRGFRAMDKSEAREIQSKGGKASGGNRSNKAGKKRGNQ